MKKEDKEDLFYIIENNLLKKDSVFVLNDGRLLFCNPEIENTKNPLRVGSISGNIEINYKRFMQFPSDFRFWLLCWGMCRYSCSEIESDQLATKVYSNNFKLSKLLPQFIEMLRHAPTESNRDRLECVKKLVVKS